MKKVIELLKKIILVDLLRGLWITGKYTVAPVYTEQYPKERPDVAPRYRGAPKMMVDDQGKTTCIACDLCAVVCPEDCIIVMSTRDPESRKKLLTDYIFDMSRCLFCGYCEEVCPTDAIQLTQDFETACYTRDEMVLDLKQLEEGIHPVQYTR
ncbi:MAG: NADH-quinone oxidoreductase subunit I [Acidobacteria bacterium]|nr:NADH-quinone oxidoreductase subunit I [Acidobacteriota bacterium]